LTPSPANVRKSGTGIGIEELAASIAAHGLLQNLQVRSAKGGKFEVVRVSCRRLLVNCRKNLPWPTGHGTRLFSNAAWGRFSRPDAFNWRRR